MSTRSDSDIDDDFRDLYKEYTGPPGTTNNSSGQDKATTNKRSHAGSDEEDEPRDPNAVPTDFTSREAKVWEAKSKATERNWKKKKEEEMICKICGDSGHFTQGCPSTLGANRKSQDFFERVPARDPHVRALLTEKVIQNIEKDIGCKIRMDEKFLFVSGKDRLILAKGVDAVHKVINEGGDKKDSSSSRMSRSRSPERSPMGDRSRRSEQQRTHNDSPNASQFQQRFGRQEKVADVHEPPRGSQFQQRFDRQDKVGEERSREDLQKISRNSPLAYGNDKARGYPSRSKSPANPSYRGNSYNSFDGHNQSLSGFRTDGLHNERKASDARSGYQHELPVIPHTLEELELEYKREAMELGKIRDKEEDEENYKHREAIREMRENYMKKLAIVRGTHAKQWEDFLRLDAQRHQQQTHLHMSGPDFGGYKQQVYSEYDGSANPQFARASIHVDPRNSYPNPMDNYPTRSHGAYGDFQRQKRDGYGKAYTRY